MIEQIIQKIQNELVGVVSESQMAVISQVLSKHLMPIFANATTKDEKSKTDMLALFIAAKRVEGCSEKSLR